MRRGGNKEGNRKVIDLGHSMLSFLYFGLCAMTGYIGSRTIGVLILVRGLGMCIFGSLVFFFFY